MNAPAEDIKDILLNDSSLGLIFAENLFLNKEPDNPDNCVTIFNTGGDHQLTLNKTEVYEYPSIQIRVRNINHTSAWALIDKIKTLLHGLSQEIVNGTLYTVVYCSSGPALLDWDENGRARLIINFNIQRR